MLPPMDKELLVFSNARISSQDLISKVRRARHLCGLCPLIHVLMQIYMYIFLLLYSKVRISFFKILEI